MSFVHMRIARPVADLDQSAMSYCQGLGLREIANFTDHQGFSGIMLGRENLQWHIELTTCHYHPVKPCPTQEDLLVLYYPEHSAWEQVCSRMVESGFRQVQAFNPYWDINGQTFEDRDGYRVVIQNRRWPMAEE